MPLSLSKLVANRATAAIDFGDGDVLHVAFYPARITSRMLLDIADSDRLKDLPNDRALAVMSSATDTLLTLLASWDLAETDAASGQETILPLDRAHIEALGLSIQWKILGGIVQAQAGGANPGNAPNAQAPEAN